MVKPLKAQTLIYVHRYHCVGAMEAFILIESNCIPILIQPTYRMEWWHLGGPLLVARSEPQGVWVCFWLTCDHGMACFAAQVRPAWVDSPSAIVPCGIGAGWTCLVWARSGPQQFCLQQFVVIYLVTRETNLYCKKKKINKYWTAL